MTRVTSPRIRFTVAEYEKMADAGIFGDRRAELINGRIYHMAAVSKCNIALHRVALATDWIVIQGTLRMDVYSAPDPDFVWLPVPIGTPSQQWPSPILLIEVSHTTYKRDSGVKLRKYAEHGVREYWIVNIRADRVEVHRDPQNPSGDPADCRYGDVQHFARGQSIALLLRPQVSLAVDDLLP